MELAAIPKIRKVILEYQNLIPKAPRPQSRLRGDATKNDETTVESWRKTWLSNITANKKHFGSFKEHSAGQLFQSYKFQPIIVAGSGPSLKFNAHELKNRNGICLVSCLHNFHYFEDLGLEPEFYCSLDAGKIVEKEVTEGCTKDTDWYWERSKDRKLLAYIGSDPELLKRWQGEIYFFNAPVPYNDLNAEIDKIEKFNLYLSNGGNVLGACVYASMAILGASSLVFVGADFSFGYPDCSDESKPVHRFHSWKSDYDKDMGATQLVTDIFGNKVHTWPSYYGFKSFFDWLVQHVPLSGGYINATEGGCLGAYPEGNINAMRYMDLKNAIKYFSASEEIREPCENPEVDYKKILY